MQMAAAKRRRTHGDKQDTLVTLQSELQSFAMRLHGHAAPEVAAVLASIQRCQPLAGFINTMDSDTAKSLSKALSTTTNMDHRAGIITKHIYGAELAALKDLENRVNTARDALGAAAYLATVTSYASTTTSAVDWSAIHADILERVG